MDVVEIVKDTIIFFVECVLYALANSKEAQAKLLEIEQHLGIAETPPEVKK